MIRFSGSYANTEKNFVIINIDNEENIKHIDEKLYGLLCVVQNIIQRGTISKPSDYLKNEIGPLDDILNNVFLLPKNEPIWKNIKGDDENIDYPAEKFFEVLLPKYLGDYAFLQKLIVPEAEFSDVICKHTVLDGQQVDFFIPQLKMVIEIDGASHNNHIQISKDNERDKALIQNNIDIIRIKTSDIREETLALKEAISEIKKKAEASDIINQYINDEKYGVDSKRLKYDAVYRCQMLLLESLKCGLLNLCNPISINIINSDVKDIDIIVRAAYKDLCIWIENVAQLLKLSINMPEVILQPSEENSINIDICMYTKYTDILLGDRKTIYVRTGYFFDHNNYVIANADTLDYKFTVESEEEDNKALVFILKNIYGFTSFNDGQIQIIKNTLEKKDTVGILPTGGGKSLTYQLVALLQPGITIVVVPIISLMQDQKRGMDEKQIDRSAFISSAQTGEEKERVISEMKEGKYQFVWISPERFQNIAFRTALGEINRKKNFALAVLDEVHCLSEWGHDFRVSYLALIPTIRRYCPEATILGLTATASQAVLEDLKVEFEIDGENVKALTSMDRPELVFHRIIVSSEEERREKILEIVNLEKGDYRNLDGTIKHKRGLIFCKR